MKTTDISLLKNFYTVFNRQVLTEEVYGLLLDYWGLKNINLEEEQEKILQKKSNLTKSRRDAIPEFIILRKILDDKAKAAKEAADLTIKNESLNNNQISLESDQISL